MAPRALPRFIATTGPTATVSSSADFPGDAGYTTYPAPPISRWDEDGFSSCSAHPCHRAAPTTPPERIDVSVRIRRFVLPSPEHRKLGFRRNKESRPPRGSLALRPGDSLTIPKMALSVGFRTFGFPPVCDSSYRAPDSCPGGTACPAQRAALASNKSIPPCWRVSGSTPCTLGVAGESSDWWRFPGGARSGPPIRLRFAMGGPRSLARGPPLRTSGRPS